MKRIFHNRRVRRAGVALLLIAGGMLMWLAPETGLGLIILVLGVGLEALGIAVEHSASH